MKLNVKDWKTTVAGIVAGLVVIAGMVWPDKIDADTGQVIETAVGEIITGVGALIGLVTGLKAKDEKK